MRQYRGKRIDNGEWVEGFFVTTEKSALILPDVWVNDETKAYIQHGNDDGLVWNIDCECYEVIKETVGQDTGLKDKNGRKIWENCEINKKYKVEWKYNRFVLTSISTGDIIEFKKGEQYEVTA